MRPATQVPHLTFGLFLLAMPACGTSLEGAGALGEPPTGATGPTPIGGATSGPRAAGSDAGTTTSTSSDAGAGPSTSCSPGQTRTCYPGPLETRGVGVCHEGMETCVRQGEFGVWGPCVNAIGPADTPTGSCACTPTTPAPAKDTTSKLCGGTHSECDCGRAGGELVDIGQGCRICRFGGDACPAAWTLHDDWRTTANGSSCGTEVQLASTGPGGTADGCPAVVPAVQTPTMTYMLTCDRGSGYCCGAPPSGIPTPQGKPWSSHAPDVVSFSQGYNACGCACGPEHCTTATATCTAPTIQVGCR